MAVINAPGSTLQTIINKIRRITRTPSVLQLSDQEIGDYINTFVIYDMPDSIKTFDFRTTFTWYCNPYQDVYNTDTSVLPVGDPLYNFKNLYISVHPPVYLAGNEVYYTQSREEFYRNYPQQLNIQQIATGDNVTTFFFGTITSIPIQSGTVVFSAISINNEGLKIYDIPNNPSDGLGLLYDVDTNLAVGTINYVTGDYSLTFSAAPLANTQVNIQCYPYQAAMPRAVLYYANQFTLRPIPDQPYAITMDVFKRPTALLDTDNSVPELNEMWQYIAWGASKKIFEDRMDMDSVAQLMSEFKQQEEFVLNKTVMELKNQRVATIYVDTQNANDADNVYGFGKF